MIIYSLILAISMVLLLVTIDYVGNKIFNKSKPNKFKSSRNHDHRDEWYRSLFVDRRNWYK